MAILNRKLKVAFQGPLDRDLEEYLTFEDLDLKGLFHFVVRGMQCSYDPVVENGTSELLPNSTWTGLIGLLNRSEVDFAPADFIETEDEWHAMTFNYPYFIDEIVFAAKKPRYSPEAMALFRTLSLPVWLSLLASIVLVTLVCWTTLKYRCATEDVVFHVLAISLNQQGTIIPKSGGEILLLCTWVVAMALFTSSFKSVLLSFLSFPPLTVVRTVPELASAVRAGKYSAMAIVDDHITRYLLESPNEDVRLIGQNTLQIPAGYVEDLFSSKQPNLVYVYPRTYLLFAEEELHVSKDNMGTYLRATAVSKDFCCKDEVDMFVHRFRAAGIDQKIYRFGDFQTAFYLFSEQIKADGDDKARKITLTDISGAFILLVGGLCLSVCILVIELCVKRIDEREKMKRKRKLQTTKQRKIKIIYER